MPGMPGYLPDLPQQSQQQTIAGGAPTTNTQTNTPPTNWDAAYAANQANKPVAPKPEAPQPFMAPSGQGGFSAPAAPAPQSFGPSAGVSDQQAPTVTPTTQATGPAPRTPTSMNTGGGNIMVQDRRPPQPAPDNTTRYEGEAADINRQLTAARQSGSAGQVAYLQRQLDATVARQEAEAANQAPPMDPGAPGPDGGPPQWFQDWQNSQNQAPDIEPEWSNPYAEGGDLYGQFGNFDMSGGAGNRQLQNPIYGGGGYFDPNNPVNIPDATEYQAVPWSGYNTFNPLSGGGGMMGMPGMPRGMGNSQGMPGPPQGMGANGFGIAPMENPQGPAVRAPENVTSEFQEPPPQMLDGNKAMQSEYASPPGQFNGAGGFGIAPPEGDMGAPTMATNARTLNTPTPDGGPAQSGPVTMDQNGNVVPGQNLSPQAQAQNAQFQQFQELMNPVFERQQEAERQRLANQGLPVSGEAYDSAFGDVLDSQNRQMSQAAWEAVGVGNAEDQRQFGNQMTGAEFGSQESQRMFQNMFQNQQAGLDDAYRNRQLALQQYLGLQNNDTQLEGQRIGAAAQTAMAQAQLAAQNARSASELEMAQMQMQQAQEQFQYSMQLQQGQQSWQNSFADRDWQFNAGMNSRNQWFNEMNQFMGTGYAQLGMPNVPMLDATGAYQIGTNSANDRFNAQNSMYQNAQQRQADMWGAGIGAAGSFAMMSSRTLKEDIVEPPPNIIEDIRKLDVKQWRYKGESQRFIGPILEDTPASLRDEETVNLANIIGGLVLTVQQLAEKVDRLEAQR